MNFIIFRNFSIVFLNLFGFILNLKYLKYIFISHVDMATDMARAITHRHVATYVHATWCMRVHVLACVSACVRECK